MRQKRQTRKASHPGQRVAVQDVHGEDFWMYGALLGRIYGGPEDEVAEQRFCGPGALPGSLAPLAAVISAFQIIPHLAQARTIGIRFQT
jgi:hypothetical protein